MSTRILGYLVIVIAFATGFFFGRFSVLKDIPTYFLREEVTITPVITSPIATPSALPSVTKSASVSPTRKVTPVKTVSPTQ